MLEQLFDIYWLIGGIYVLINWARGLIRNIDDGTESTMVLLWWGFWPFCLVALIIRFFFRKFKFLEGKI